MLKVPLNPSASMERSTSSIFPKNFMSAESTATCKLENPKEN